MCVCTKYIYRIMMYNYIYRVVPLRVLHELHSDFTSQR